MPPGRGSGTPRTSRAADGSREPVRVMEVVREVCARLPEPDPNRCWKPPPERTPLERFLESLGPRHRAATLDNFRPSTPEAEKALLTLRDYAARLQDNLDSGKGILLFGPSGTGKDHLLAGLGKAAAGLGRPIKRITGAELFRGMRDAMSRGGEGAELDALKYVRLLILSDPLPPLGSLTPYQASALYELVDFRWERRLPTWCSLNVANAKEADERFGAPIVDRIQDGALVIACNWPSYRKPEAVIKCVG